MNFNKSLLLKWNTSSPSSKRVFPRYVASNNEDPKNKHIRCIVQTRQKSKSRLYIFDHYSAHAKGTANLLRTHPAVVMCNARTLLQWDRINPCQKKPRGLGPATKCLNSSLLPSILFTPAATEITFLGRSKLHIHDFLAQILYSFLELSFGSEFTSVTCSLVIFWHQLVLITGVEWVHI